MKIKLLLLFLFVELSIQCQASSIKQQAKARYEQKKSPRAELPIKRADALPGLQIRTSTLYDAAYLKKWFMDPSTQGFYMDGEQEVDHAVFIWNVFKDTSLTCELNGEPVGMVQLQMVPWKRIAHQAEFGVIVAPGYRNKGIGTYLLQNLMQMAKEKFKIELLHLQVYEGNPAINLYKRLGFREYARQEFFLKGPQDPLARILMEKRL